MRKYQVPKKMKMGRYSKIICENVAVATGPGDNLTHATEPLT